MAKCAESSCLKMKILYMYFFLKGLQGNTKISGKQYVWVFRISGYLEKVDIRCIPIQKCEFGYKVLCECKKAKCRILGRLCCISPSLFPSFSSHFSNVKQGQDIQDQLETTFLNVSRSVLKKRQFKCISY